MTQRLNDLCALNGFATVRYFVVFFQYKPRLSDPNWEAVRGTAWMRTPELFGLATLGSETTEPEPDKLWLNRNRGWLLSD